jgi:hypothetical protein
MLKKIRRKTYEIKSSVVGNLGNCMTRNLMTYGKCRIFSFGDPGANKIWRPLSVTTNLEYENLFFVLMFHSKYKCELIFRYLRDANVSITSVESMFVLWMPQGARLGRVVR